MTSKSLLMFAGLTACVTIVGCGGGGGGSSPASITQGGNTTGATTGATTSGVSTGSTNGSSTGVTGSTGSTGGGTVTSMPFGNYTGTFVDPNAGTTPKGETTDEIPAGVGRFSFTYTVDRVPPITTITFPDGSTMEATITLPSNVGGDTPFNLGLTPPSNLWGANVTSGTNLSVNGSTYSSSNLTVSEGIDHFTNPYPLPATISMTLVSPTTGGTTGETTGSTTTGTNGGTTGSTGNSTGLTTGNTTGSTQAGYVTSIPYGTYSGTFSDPNAGTSPSGLPIDPTPQGDGTFTFTYPQTGLYNPTTTITFPGGQTLTLQIWPPTAPPTPNSIAGYTGFTMIVSQVETTGTTTTGGCMGCGMGGGGGQTLWEVQDISPASLPWDGGLYQNGNTYFSTDLVVTNVNGLSNPAYPLPATITLTKTD